MQRIPTLLKKIAEIAEKGDSNSIIDIDLMLDYTKVVYADLLEWRSRKTFVSSIDAGGGNIKNDRQYVEAENKVVETPVVKEEVKAEIKVDPALVPEKTVATAPVASVVANTPGTKPRTDVRQSIGINDKYLFMSELFGNNKDDYDRALDTINNFTTYSEAEEWLNENIDAGHGNSDDNDTLELFRSVLNVYFNTK